MMKVRCAWCGRDMGEQLGPDGAVSDGICAGCAAAEWIGRWTARLPATSDAAAELVNLAWESVGMGRAMDEAERRREIRADSIRARRAGLNGV